MTAARGKVGTLVLTHMVPPPSPAPGPGDGRSWIELAAAHFDGEIVLAEDLDRIEV